MSDAGFEAADQVAQGGVEPFVDGEVKGESRERGEGKWEDERREGGERCKVVKRKGGKPQGRRGLFVSG